MLAAGGALAALGGAGTEAFAWAPRRVQLVRQEAAVPALPPGLAGLRIVHLSDIHLYDGLHPAARRAIDLVREADPDITVITGDLAEHVNQLGHVGSFVEECRGRLATAVTLGNWEYQVGITPLHMRRTCEKAGATFLFNEALTLTVGDSRVAVVGLDDPLSGAPDPGRALREVPPDAVTVWGFHAPGYADAVRSESLPAPVLALAGHTHGGQIRLPLFPPITPPGSGRFLEGWYHDSFAPFYVSRGVGTTAIRARFRCPPEVGVFTLRPA
jgi:predicted MPP superfamily phosphohydrolase